MSTANESDPTKTGDSANSSQSQPEHAKPNPPIRLDDFIKRSGLVGTGGEAKLRIQGGEVLVNGEVETRRRKQLSIGDTVNVVGETLEVTSAEI